MLKKKENLLNITFKQLNLKKTFKHLTLKN